MTHHAGSDEGPWMCSTPAGVTTTHDTEAAAKAEQMRLRPVAACVWFCDGIEEGA